MVAEELGTRQFQLAVPAEARWLFYGPSYIAQIFEAIVAANQDNIVTHESLKDLKDSDDLAKAVPSLPRIGCSDNVMQCNVLGDQQPCGGGEGPSVTWGVHHVTLQSGAVLVGVHNNKALQDETDSGASVEALQGMLRMLNFSHAFYMQPHNWALYQGQPDHCMTEVQLSSSLSRTADHEDPDCCQMRDNSNTPSDVHLECVNKSALWQVVTEGVPRVTLVAPFGVPPPASAQETRLASHAKGGEGGGAGQVGVYYTGRLAQRYDCGCNVPDGTMIDKKSQPWLDSRRAIAHQCTVLKEDNGVVFAGPVLAMAEELIEAAG